MKYAIKSGIMVVNVRNEGPFNPRKRIVVDFGGVEFSADTEHEALTRLLTDMRTCADKMQKRLSEILDEVKE